RPRYGASAPSPASRRRSRRQTPSTRPAWESRVAAYARTPGQISVVKMETGTEGEPPNGAPNPWPPYHGRRAPRHCLPANDALQLPSRSRRRAVHATCDAPSITNTHRYLLTSPPPLRSQPAQPLESSPGYEILDF